MPDEFEIVSINLEGAYFFVLVRSGGTPITYVDVQGSPTKSLALAWNSPRITDVRNVVFPLAKVLEFAEQQKINIAGYPLNFRVAEVGEAVDVTGYPSMFWGQSSAPEYNQLLQNITHNPMYFFLELQDWPMSIRVGSNSFRYPSFVQTFMSWDPKGYLRFVSFTAGMRFVL